MSDIVDYEVVMFQGEDDGVCIFHSVDLNECRKFAKEQESQFKEFIQKGFPVESLPEFLVVAYHADQSTSFVEDEQE